MEPHPHDEGKFQSTFDTYGHGKGKGKSKTSIYKHHKKWKVESEKVDDEKVDDETPHWENLDWLEPDDEEQVPSSIPRAVQDMAMGGEYGDGARATQRQLVMWGFMGIDRLFSHWGKGVTQNSEWEISRSPTDYIVMESATTQMMDAHGMRINMSPSMVFLTVMGAAYVPPVVEVARKADPRRTKGIINRIKRIFRRRKKLPPIEEVSDGE